MLRLWRNFQPNESPGSLHSPLFICNADLVDIVLIAVFQHVIETQLHPTPPTHYIIKDGVALCEFLSIDFGLNDYDFQINAWLQFPLFCWNLSTIRICFNGLNHTIYDDFVARLDVILLLCKCFIKHFVQHLSKWSIEYWCVYPTWVSISSIQKKWSYFFSRSLKSICEMQL